MDLITRIWFDAVAGVLKILRNQLWTKGASTARWGKLEWSQRRPVFLIDQAGVHEGQVDVPLFVDNLLDSHDIVGRLNFPSQQRTMGLQTVRPPVY